MNFFINLRKYSRINVYHRVNDTGDKLFSGVNDTGNKFIAGVPRIFSDGVIDTGEQFIAGDNDTGDKFIAGDKNKDAMEVGSCQS